MRNGIKNRSRTATRKARAQRRQPSVAERVLWNCVRDHRIGFHIRRQVPVGPYVLDFYCAEASLAIECDGEQHDPVRDAIRDGFLSGRGIETFRIPNADLLVLNPNDPVVDAVRLLQRRCEERAGRPAFP